MARRAVIEFNESYRMLADADTDHLRIWGEELTIRRNYWHGNIAADCPMCHSDCVQSYDLPVGRLGSVLRNVRIDANTCFNAHQAVIIQDYTTGSPPPTASGLFDDIRLTNNVFAHGRIGGGADEVMSWCVLFAGVTNVAAYHNTFVDCGQVGYRYATTAVHRNNIVYATSSAPMTTTESRSVTNIDNLFFGPFTYSYVNNINNRNPLFQDSSEAGYRLSGLSPARDVGAQTGVVHDRSGADRTDGKPDLGAYEFAVPSAPVNLRIRK